MDLSGGAVLYCVPLRNNLHDPDDQEINIKLYVVFKAFSCVGFIF